MVSLGRYETRGGDAGKKGEGGGGVSGLLGCHCLLVANIDDALTSLTFGWVLAAAGLVYSRSPTNTEHQSISIKKRVS